MTYDAYGAKAGPATPETDAAYHVALASPQKTLRDEFAMAALTGGMANSDPYYFGTPAQCATMAYEIADAMMKARG